MDLNNFLQSKLFKRIIIGIGLLAIILFSFSAGIFVGYNKARFSYAWGENYDRNFGGGHRTVFGFPPMDPQPAGMPGLPPNPGSINAHGVFGTILNIASSNIAISSRDGIERTATIFSSTIMREGRETIKTTDLKIGDPVVIIGPPDEQGQINASFVRILR